ncbi:MAG TPA: NADP-dependent oxidoreductase, partial [Candidatus Baltobacteraceae bacterium]|nr:NADP-dependent oxidoreductase [Candidatus Baltobacteraceae bacterium]
MKAAVIENRGDTAAIKSVADPQPGERDILVRVMVAGVNPIDWKVREAGERRLPFVLGQDFAGIVVATGARAHKYDVDERVFGIARDHGSYAQLTVVPEDDHEQPVAKIPDALGDAEAAALPTAGLTALASLDALGVESTTKLLILGATGGVGSLAVQIAHDRGATVIGTARGDNEELARSYGVDEFVAYDRDDPVAAIKRSHPEGIDAVLDVVDDSAHLRAFGESVRDGGRVVSTIGAADIDWFRKRNVTGINLVMSRTPQSSHAGLRALARMVEEGRLRVPIAAEHPLPEAERALEQSKSGKI